MITHIESLYGAEPKEVFESDYYVRPRIWGEPRVTEMTVDELRCNILRLENQIHRKDRLIDALVAILPNDVPLPDGIGHWDGITKYENEVEAARRKEARV